jgi:hypothetical protein
MPYPAPELPYPLIKGLFGFHLLKSELIREPHESRKFMVSLDMGENL